MATYRIKRFSSQVKVNKPNIKVNSPSINKQPADIKKSNRGGSVESTNQQENYNYEDDES